MDQNLAWRKRPGLSVALAAGLQVPRVGTRHYPGGEREGVSLPLYWHAPLESLGWWSLRRVLRASVLFWAWNAVQGRLLIVTRPRVTQLGVSSEEEACSPPPAPGHGISSLRCVFLATRTTKPGATICTIPRILLLCGRRTHVNLGRHPGLCKAVAPSKRLPAAGFCQDTPIYFLSSASMWPLVRAGPLFSIMIPYLYPL